MKFPCKNMENAIVIDPKKAIRECLGTRAGGGPLGSPGRMGP